MKKSISILLVIMGTLFLGASVVGPRIVAQTSDLVPALLADYKWRSIGPGARRRPHHRCRGARHRLPLCDCGGRLGRGLEEHERRHDLDAHLRPLRRRRRSATSRSSRTIRASCGSARARRTIATASRGATASTNPRTAARRSQNVGLRDTFQIARVVTHPANPDIVYVAAVGNLWGFTGDRGVFKTIDGGKTWQKLAGGLPSDGKTGATDLAMDPGNPEVLYAAFYQRLRTAVALRQRRPERRHLQDDRRRQDLEETDERSAGR